MQFPNILALLLCAPVAALEVQGKPANPVSRIVKLLQDLQKHVIEEGKKEKDLYEGFVCWGESVITQKTKTNDAAQSRMDELKAYIEDVESGKIEFTTERADLEKLIKELTGEIDRAEASREKEKKDFDAAKSEMEAAIKALEKAVKVLNGVQTDFAQEKKSALLSFGARLGTDEGYAQRMEDMELLQQAIRIGNKYLSKSDAFFLQRLLSGDVMLKPKDWKKLNRKADFKMKYKSRSGKILQILQKMLWTFEDNLKDAEGKEADAVAFHEKFMEAKKKLKDGAEKRLVDAKEEMAMRGMSLEDSKEEIESLEEQIKADKKFIEQTQGQLDDMKEQWDERCEIRQMEIEAISKAIAILHSDEARDTFSSSYKSQGYLFLQTVANDEGQRGRAVSQVIRATAKKVGDRRLLALAMQTALRQAGHFDEVIAAIDKMIETLKKEAEEDLKTKEDCEKTRAEKSREAVLMSRDIDERTDGITKILAEIKAVAAEIKEKKEAKAALEKELEEATKIREDEHDEWKATDKMDKAAVELIKKAQGVLEKMYKEISLSLVQKAKVVPVEAGKAPPPPPATWDQPYGGKQDEGTGIVMILSMLADDIKKDSDKAEKEEEESKTEYETFKKETESSIAELESAITDLELTLSKKEESLEEEKSGRLDVKKSLDGVMKSYKDIGPDCDYFQTNFNIRYKNRNIEISGLMEAKGILLGSDLR